MKMILLTSAMYLLTSTFFAQTVPNGGFENWIDVGIEQGPIGWVTTNFGTASGFPISVTKSTIAHSGSFSMKCTSVSSPTSGTLAGEAFLGKLDLAAQTLEESVPFAARPDSLVAWFKYSPIGGDSASITLYLSKWNASTNQEDEVGMLESFYFTSSSVFKRVSFPINYFVSTQPDSLYLYLKSSNKNVHPGSSLWVDDVAFIYSGPLGTIEVPLEEQFAYYPNPTDKELTLRANETGTLEVFNALGVHVETITTQAGETTTLKTSEFKDGVYFLKNQRGATDLFVVQH